MVAKQLERQEEQTFLEDNTLELPPSDIVAYNELRSCADLFRMYTSGILEIKPEFQREVVWPGTAQTRFIDSLVKGLPIPSMCFSLDYNTRRYQVIDGLQRMWSITQFLSGGDWVLANLDDIDPHLSGKAASKFVDKNSELHKYYEIIENLSLPVTILRCDYSKKSHKNYLFTIFHRLNTGGMKLNNQEIRNCIYGGPFNELLKELDANKSWMRVNRMKRPGEFRYTKQELILRCLAFHDGYEEYTGKLAKFLNDYMDDHRDAPEEFLDNKRELFRRTIDLVYTYVLGGKVPRKLSVSVFEGILVGVARNVAYLESQPKDHVQKMYQNMLALNEFTPESLSEGLARRDKVIERLSAAEKVFAGK